MSQAFDVIIIGAGIMGCATAFELAKRGVNVAVLERDHLGAGSTGKSSAIIRQHYSNEVTARMALHGLRVFQNFQTEVGGESGFTEAGILLLATEKDLEGLAVNVAMMQKIGIDTEIIYPDEMRKRWPYLDTEGLAGAAYEPEAGQADPNMTLNSYAAAARRYGAEIFLDTEVTGVRFAGGKVAGVDTPQGAFAAPIVLNCAGPWGRPVAKMGGVDLPINACRVQISFFRRPETHQGPHPIVADFPNEVYWRNETGNLTLVGLIDPSEADDVVDPDTYNERMDSEFAMESGEGLVMRFPAMEQSLLTGGYAAVYAITPDWHPVIDEIIPGSGFFACAGFSGHGFKLAPAVGLMTADMLMGRETPGFGRDLFRLSRFTENDPVTGKYEYSIVG